jgi:hypothetical protein
VANINATDEVRAKAIDDRIITILLLRTWAGDYGCFNVWWRPSNTLSRLGAYSARKWTPILGKLQAR